MARFVLDTFAPFAYFMDEPASDLVDTLLYQAAAGEHEVYMAAFNVGELIYKLWQLTDRDRASDALYVLQSWPIEIVDADRALVVQAAGLKAERRMGYLDCFSAALAIQRDAAVVTGDSGFTKVEDLVNIYWLPRA